METMELLYTRQEPEPSEPPDRALTALLRGAARRRFPTPGGGAGGVARPGRTVCRRGGVPRLLGGGCGRASGLGA